MTTIAAMMIANIRPVMLSTRPASRRPVLTRNSTRSLPSTSVGVASEAVVAPGTAEVGGAEVALEAEVELVAEVAEAPEVAVGAEVMVEVEVALVAEVVAEAEVTGGDWVAWLSERS